MSAYNGTYLDLANEMHRSDSTISQIAGRVTEGKQCFIRVEFTNGQYRECDFTEYMISKGWIRIQRWNNGDVAYAEFTRKLS